MKFGRTALFRDLRALEPDRVGGLNGGALVGGVGGCLIDLRAG